MSRTTPDPLEQNLSAADSDSRWLHLDFFSADEGERYFARRDCPACEGGGLIEVVPRSPHGGDTDTCGCVRRLPA